VVHADLDGVARHCVLDCDGTDEQMAALDARVTLRLREHFDRFADGRGVRRDRHAVLLEPRVGIGLGTLPTGAAARVELDGVAGTNRENGLLLRRKLPIAEFSGVSLTWWS
jgi:hypothetical protein